MSTASGRIANMRLGKALVLEGAITQNQLRHALQVQQDNLDRRRLGDVLLDLDYVTRRQLRDVARKYSHRVPIGSILFDSGIITREQLDAALKVNKETSRQLCEVLIDAKVITEEQVANALSRQLDYPCIIPNKRFIDRGLLRLLPQPFLRQHIVLPLSKDGEIITILMHNPLDDQAIAMLDQQLGGRYEIAVAPRSHIEKAIKELFDEQVLMGTGTKGETDTKATSSFQRYELQKVRPDVGADNQVVNIVDYLLSNAIQQRASDIHIESMYNRLRVRHRIDGKLLFETDLPSHLSNNIVRRIKVLAGLDVTDNADSFDGNIYVSLDNQQIDMRVSFFPTVLGTSITIRALTREVGLKDLHEIGMLPRVQGMVHESLDAPSGMLIFSGPTGAGKTTSMYACLNYLNTGEVKICTLESPVEFSIEGITQCQVRGGEDNVMSERVRAMMRQDPDVIVLGEVNNESSAVAAVDAALSGHKVMTTIHADDSFGAVMRLLDMGLRTYLLSSTGLMAFSQRLIRQICPHCRTPHTPSRRLFRYFRMKDMDADSLEFFRGRGCERCNQLGFIGRLGLFEMLAVDDAVGAAFLENCNALGVRRVAEEADKFLPLREAAFMMALNGSATLEEVIGILSFSDRQGTSEMNLSPAIIQAWNTLPEQMEEKRKQ
ncbi:hypothetical protein CVU37_03265 [candidate division BRC1 bacterium HGW-BRC1-1]|nr:MAG: hypothetical protein CVU37_03265 [candidate division BRC1 bacterium HGW-BRC1-1]